MSSNRKDDDPTADLATQSTPAKPVAEGRVEIEDAPKCSCGHSRYHHRVVGLPHYSFWKRLLMVAGMSSLPKRTDFKCRDCNEVFDFETDNLRLHRKV